MQTLDAGREVYMSAYRQALSKAAKGHDAAVPEVKVEATEEKLRKPYRYYTLDIFCKRAEKSHPIEVNLASANAMAPVRENWQGLDVTLHPFVWNGLEFRLDGDLADDARLVAWMDKWMDVAEKKPKDRNRFSQIAHNVTQPEKRRRLDLLGGFRLGAARRLRRAGRGGARDRREAAGARLVRLSAPLTAGRAG
jgi:hypothetical protein